MDAKKREKEIVSIYKKQGPRVETKARVKLKGRPDFSLWYTPGVGTAASYLAKHPKDARSMSIKKNSVAIISDGSAVLGLGNIGPYGALPVMEGKALIFKEKAGIDAWPLVLDTQDPEEIIKIVKAVAPTFGGVNLEDIAAPKCFEIEERLVRELDIPIMHDDQHGTAIVVLAGVLNALKVVKKRLPSARIVISGAGAAGTATAKLLYAAGARDILVLDREGIIDSSRSAPHKKHLATFTNRNKMKGGLREALMGADVLLGVSGPGLATASDIKLMNKGAIVFAMANPVPEILPEEAKRGGAVVIGTGRSDYPNQINNSLAFPGVFRGALDKGITKITDATKLRAARAIAALVPRPTPNKVIPDMLDPRVAPAVARAVR
jgi:malate dehydrogenase (oxaloacetate-decarboxylating)